MLYGIFIGIRRRHNPFVGRSSSRSGRLSTNELGQPWREERWEGQEEEIVGSSMEEEGEILEVNGSEDDEGEEEEVDEDDIIDLPKSGAAELRSRLSRVSLREEGGMEGQRESLRRSQYGSIASFGKFYMSSESVQGSLYKRFI